MFCGLMSRWITPASCATSSARQSCLAIGSITCTGNRPRRRTSSFSDLPSTNSIVMKYSPRDSPRSCVRTTLRWEIFRASRISLLKRSSAVASDAMISGFSVLIATTS